MLFKKLIDGTYYQFMVGRQINFDNNRTKTTWSWNPRTFQDFSLSYQFTLLVDLFYSWTYKTGWSCYRKIKLLILVEVLELVIFDGLFHYQNRFSNKPLFKRLHCSWKKSQTKWSARSVYNSHLCDARFNLLKTSSRGFCDQAKATYAFTCSGWWLNRFFYSSSSTLPIVWTKKCSVIPKNWHCTKLEAFTCWISWVAASLSSISG